MTKTVTLTGLPSASTQYPKAVGAMLPVFGKPSRVSADAQVPDTVYRIENLRVDRDRLREYCRTTGTQFGADLPLTYLFVLQFPLAMELMVSAEFPFAAVGSVHAENRIERFRRMGVDEPLTIVTHALTDRIRFSGKRAVGVQWLHSDQPQRATARREVLLCGGAIASPQILQRSGVGPADLLRSLDIDLVHHLPGVGANLQDHLEMYLQYECKKPVSLAPALKLYNQPAIGAEWLFLGTGIGASNQFEAGGFIRSDAEFDWPNLQYHFLPVAINYNGSNPIKAHSFQMHVGSMRSPSRGRIHVRSKDPREHPSILFNYMSHDQDWREFRAAIRITREIFAQPALAPYSGREISPGSALQTDAQIDAFVREHAETAYHPSCSNKMGHADDPMAVVDGQGRVHGLEGLRIVDASIMPQVVTGNLNAPTIMMAEKLADVIRGRTPLARSTAPYYKANGAPVRKQG